MAVKIRLRRMGTNKKPFYRIIVADARSPRNGRFIENLGYYNPCTEPVTLELKSERAQYWLGVGAQPTAVTRGLLQKNGLDCGKLQKMSTHAVKKAKESEA